MKFQPRLILVFNAGAPNFSPCSEINRELGMSNHQVNIDAPLAGMKLGALLDSKEVAAILKISPKTVHKLGRERKLGCVQVTSRERRFTPEQVQDYIRTHSTEVRVDKKDPRLVQSPPKKGGIGRKLAGDIGTDLVKEIRSLCR